MDVRALEPAQRVDFNPDRLGQIVAFLAVADRLSFSEAATVLGLTGPTISRKIARLEDTLGVRLFNRTTRKVALTEAGHLYDAHCRAIVEKLNAADALLDTMTQIPQGTLRISVPVAFGHLHMSKAVVAFLHQNRKIAIEAEYSDRFADMINENIDLAIRIGSLPDSSIVARKIASSNRVLVAAPSYVARFGMPQHPSELARHECVRYRLYSSAGNVWSFQRGAEHESVTVDGSFRCDNSEVVGQVIAEGHGIGLVAGYICYNQVRSGELVRILPDWECTPRSNIYLCYSSRRYLGPKVRAFSDFLAQYFRVPEWQDF